MSEKAIVVGFAGDAAYVKGSALFKCSRCHGKLWLAPTGQKFQRENSAEVMCSDCALTLMSQHPESVRVEGTPGAREEFLEALRDEVYKKLERHGRN